MKLQELVNKCHKQSLDHGWWNGGDGCGKPECNHASRSPLEIQALLDSEVSEFTEEIRDGRPPIYMNKDRALDRKGRGPKDEGFDKVDAMPKPEGPAVELVDYVIRLGDYFGFRGWRLAEASNATTERIELLNDYSLDDSYNPINSLHFERPLEFAAILHQFTSNFGKTIAQGKYDENAADFLRFALGAILWYFGYRGWNFDDVFRVKFAYNERRPRKHGGKLY